MKTATEKMVYTRLVTDAFDWPTTATSRTVNTRENKIRARPSLPSDARATTRQTLAKLHALLILFIPFQATKKLSQQCACSRKSPPGHHSE